MHSKVIIASLVFGLSLGFTAMASNSVSFAVPKEETYALQKQENNPSRALAARGPVIVDGGGGSHTHVYNYSYSYRNDAYHNANCVCGTASQLQEHQFNAYYPYGHGHNDMIHCALCDTNVWMTRMQEDGVYSDSIAQQSGRWYYFSPQTPGTYIFETTGNNDTYGELYLGDYPTTRTTYNDDGGAGYNFRISRYLNANENVFLRVRGYSWRAVNYSISVVKEPEVIQPEPMREWTIMIYACGSSLTSFESNNINEIIGVPNQPNDVNVIVETGGSPTPWYVQDSTGSYIPYNKIGRYHLRNNTLYKEADFSELTDANMGAQSTFESFLNWGLSRYPAEKVGVILLNHGGGIVGVCRDDRHGNDVLTNSEVSAALSNAFAQNDIDYNLEFIGYDACMMQLQDVAEYNSRYFNYMLASQLPTSEIGWSYTPLIGNIYNHYTIENNPYAYPDGVTLTALKETAKNFITNGYSWEQTLSVLDLTQMTSYLTAFEQLADSVIYRIAHGALSTFAIQQGVLQTYNIYGERDYGNGDCIQMLNI